MRCDPRRAARAGCGLAGSVERRFGPRSWTRVGPPPSFPPRITSEGETRHRTPTSGSQEAAHRCVVGSGESLKIRGTPNGQPHLPVRSSVPRSAPGPAGRAHGRSRACLPQISPPDLTKGVKSATMEPNAGGYDRRTRISLRLYSSERHLPPTSEACGRRSGGRGACGARRGRRSNAAADTR
jgi:hypothetical protein